MQDALQLLTVERDAALRRVDELVAAQEAFLRSVSHDLRAPLRHVTSYAALLREVLQELPDPPGQVREALGFAGTMEQSARRMGAMIDGLQAIHRAARAPLHPVPVDLCAAVHDACAALPAAQAVRWEIAPQMPALRADAALLGQLLAQVLDNAVKFSRGRPQPCIAIAARAPTPGRVSLTIADNGVGFDGSRAQELFGVFQRMHREGEFGGVGVGLALCKLIAERHGATIAAAAQPDQGCTVTLDWPGM